MLWRFVRESIFRTIKLEGENVGRNSGKDKMLGESWKENMLDGNVGRICGKDKLESKVKRKNVTGKCRGKILEVKKKKQNIEGQKEIRKTDEKR